MKPKRLKFVNASGAGFQIHADIPSVTKCVEFDLKASWQIIATEPWIQFAPKEWKDMISSVFSEMVDLWNAKNAPQEAVEGAGEQQTTGQAQNAGEQ